MNRRANDAARQLNRLAIYLPGARIFMYGAWFFTVRGGLQFSPRTAIAEPLGNPRSVFCYVPGR
jgi:hypothetical protein